ncbi:DUF11 domain-containing protein [Kitasatospora sp. NPDC059463]|uniref:DUF11 domain-containing protein n=1 Tax=unclassified Kitasatospora TaxID=2633591 RepID=UPI0036A616E0
MSAVTRRPGRHRGRPRRSLIGLLVMALLIGAGSLTIPFLSAPQSHAAAGDPFNPADPQVFIAQDIPTRLYKAVTGASGSVTFQPEGTAAAMGYNAISYNPADNYLYGIAADSTIVRIGQGGVVTRSGTGLAQGWPNVGAFAPNGSLYAAWSGGDTAWRINVTTGQIIETFKLPMVATVSDFTYAGGFFWGAAPDGTIMRFDLLGATKTVTAFPSPVKASASGFGAAWTFGNGNIGVSDNSSGTVYQVKITNPAAANPTFTLVSTSPGPSSGNNDGAASAGLPTDFSLVKSGPDLVKPGTVVTYTLKVKNNGPGNASGYTVSDTVPAPLTNVKTATPGCTVAGNTVTCVGGRTLAGVENTITITADSPATMTGCVTNTGSVLANEQDPTPGNNQSSVKTCAVAPR